ncbi:hypothetical protein HMPREF9540_00096, partial [Escherichia coli MS 115-1]
TKSVSWQHHPYRHRPVGLIRRDRVASGIGCRMRRERLIRPTYRR